METSHRSIVFQSPKFESTLLKDSERVKSTDKSK